MVQFKQVKRMKKKILILLFISIFVLVGCKKKEEVKEEVKKEVRALKEEEIAALSDYVDDLYYFDINPAKSFKTSELTNQEVLLWAAYNMGNIEGAAFSDLEEMAKNYLDFSLEPEHILCMTHSNILDSSDYSYLYDVEKKIFVKNDNHLFSFFLII